MGRSISEDERQRIAQYIVENQHLPLKQIASNLGRPYNTVYQILRSHVAVQKSLSLRYPAPTLKD